jgi:type I restriction enzyme, S subunit
MRKNFPDKVLVLRSGAVKAQLERLSFGSAQPQLTVKGIGTLKIPLPPTKAEQEAIAGALGDAVALIEFLEQLIAKKRQIKQGAMQELLTGKRRLPGFSGQWHVKRLGTVADTDPDNLASDTNPTYAFKYIALEDVDTGSLTGFSERVFCDAPSRARRKLRKDDVLVSTVRPNLKSHLWFRLDGKNWICSTGFCVVRCREGITHPGFVYFHMMAGVVNKQIEALLTGSNYPAINSGDVRELEIPLPEFEEQCAIAGALGDMEAELVVLTTKLAKARQIKQGMMQELLTGRIRLV